MAKQPDSLNFVQRLYHLKQNMQNMEEVKLQKEQVRHDQRINELSETVSELKDTEQQMITQSSSASRHFASYYLQALSVQSHNHQDAIAESRLAVEEQKQKVVASYTETEKWKTLFEDYRTDNRRQQNRDEQKQMDENSTLTFKSLNGGSQS